MIPQISPDKSIKHGIGNYELTCSLWKGALHVKVCEKSIQDAQFWLEFNNDTFPQNLKMLYESPIELYEYLEQTLSDKIEIKSPKQISISYQIGANTRRFPLYLVERKITVQERQAKIIKALSAELEILKNKQSQQNFQILNIQMAYEQKVEQCQNLKIKYEEAKQQLEEFKKKGSKSKIQSQKASLLEQQIESLKNENFNLKSSLKENVKKAQNLQDILDSQNFIISELQSQIKDGKQVISALAGQQKMMMGQDNIYGKLLVYKPLPASVNFKCYDFKDNILTKNNQSASGTGRFIPCAEPVPKTGRYHYKIRNKYSKNLPNFRLGVIARSNLTSETYMNGSQNDAIIYYCFNTDKEIIYQGGVKVEGFNIYKGNTLTVVIDRDKKQVQWYVQNNLKNVSKFPQTLEKGENLNVFVQLWCNGDQLEMLDK